MTDREEGVTVDRAGVNDVDRWVDNTRAALGKCERLQAEREQLHETLHQLRDLMGGEPLEQTAKIVDLANYIPQANDGTLAECVRDRLAGKDEALRLVREARGDAEAALREIARTGSGERARRLARLGLAASRSALSDSPRPDAAWTREWRAACDSVVERWCEQRVEAEGLADILRQERAAGFARRGDIHLEWREVGPPVREEDS